MTFTYAIALGSNRRHGRHGAPHRVVVAALDAIGQVTAHSRTHVTPPLGPSSRRFANAAALIESDEMPADLLARLKRIERDFGRRPGRRWAARVLDLDIVLWSGGAWSGDGLTIPHPAFRSRDFVLTPLAEIVPAWRDPLTGLSIRHLARRLRRAKPVDPATPAA